MNTTEVGDVAESRCIAELTGLGYPVSVPLSSGLPYDLVVELKDKMARVQVKNATLTDGAIEVWLVRTHHTSGGQRHDSKYTEDEVDSFCVYCPGTDEVYWIPFEEAPKSNMVLRVDDPEIDHPSVNWAEEYEVESRLASLG